ncbi:YaaA family protein [Candidatus Saccharibacteria bacterium]|nr:YaaA family protein [Candidatus Saccharibacteria bacterium]
MLILLHTSKTMRPPAEDNRFVLGEPPLLTQAATLAAYLKTLPASKLGQVMGLSSKLAGTTHELISSWSSAPSLQRAAIDSFLGDIYSGLQVSTWSTSDRAYADTHLQILSGLYGVLRPHDGIYPYRLEMGYKLPEAKFANLYSYWGHSIADVLPTTGPIINLTAAEYSKVVTPFIDSDRLITPSFLTVNQTTGEPTFVTVHTKVARGALAAWLIKNRIETPDELREFNNLGYTYRAELSTPSVPVFVCNVYGGLGLSVRLS